MTQEVWYKLARPDGWDFRTGKTINYRDAAQNGGTVKHPAPDASLGLCSAGVLHASPDADLCFVGASIPCSLYRVEGTPIIPFDGEKAGFLEFSNVTELDPAAHFRWRYAEAIDPLKPLALPFIHPTPDDIKLLREWASVRLFVWPPVWGLDVKRPWEPVWEPPTFPWGAVWESAWGHIWRPFRTYLVDYLWPSIGACPRDSVWASARAYAGWILSPVIRKWKGAKQRQGVYPFMSSVSLWQRGLIPSYDGRLWRLHSGPKAEVVYFWIPR